MANKVMHENSSTTDSVCNLCKFEASLQVAEFVHDGARACLTKDAALHGQSTNRRYTFTTTRLQLVHALAKNK